MVYAPWARFTATISTAYVHAGSATVGSPLDSLPAVPRSDHARSLFPGVGQSWEDRQQQVNGVMAAVSTPAV